MGNCTESQTTLVVGAGTESAAEFGVETVSCSVVAAEHVKMDVVMV